jgi:flagellar biosynthesis/type III secretory pathway protein FliH
LAAEIANKVVRRELSSDNELLRVWLEEALVAMQDARELRVRVHPDDFAVTGRFLQQLAKSIPQAASVEILPDPEISLGGCRLQSNHGQIDQQLETQLDRLAEQLS